MIDTILNSQEELFAKKNVVGFGIGQKITNNESTSENCITVFVSQKRSKSELASKDIIPAAINNIKTDVVKTGIIFAGGELASTESAVATSQENAGIETLSQRVRPAMGGFSVGHYKITAGTIATCVYDETPYPGIPGKFYILSNNHVLANSNNARIGDPILQPGPYDGGTYPGDVIANLSRFIPIQFASPPSYPLNYVDAAIAEGQFHNLNREIYWIGYVEKVCETLPQVGEIVKKTGRTTNFSTGKVLATHSIVDVSYGSGRVARFTEQIVTTNMSAGGDSGSLICNLAGDAIGLLFAGSSTITVANSILRVQDLLGIRLHP